MYTYETLQVGDRFTATRRITAEDVRKFAELTGDDNPIHLDPEYAKRTRFGRPIVHGVLLLGIISKVLGRDFPGHGSIAVALSCRFLRPVPVDSEITVEVKIAEKNRKAPAHPGEGVHLPGRQDCRGRRGHADPPLARDGSVSRFYRCGSFNSVPACTTASSSI
ncbi:MaoC family dehydratase [Rhodothermus marinus]|uniref:MaoC family dehydratase n=1 Tax=Rhodothermus marinus TaxID=29549 RepID=UPI001FB46B53|nr:MaoC family dehydratase [Rhodothermus marinus]